MDEWPAVLDDLSFALNNSISRSTGQKPLEPLYGFKPHEPLGLLFDQRKEVEDIAPSLRPAKDPSRTTNHEDVGEPATMMLYLAEHVDALDSIAQAIMDMKAQYDGLPPSAFLLSQ